MLTLMFLVNITLASNDNPYCLVARDESGAELDTICDQMNARACILRAEKYTSWTSKRKNKVQFTCVVNADWNGNEQASVKR